MGRLTYAAYVPTLPGCNTTGATIEAVEEEIRAAIRLYIERLTADSILGSAAESSSKAAYYLWPSRSTACANLWLR